MLILDGTSGRRKSELVFLAESGILDKSGAFAVSTYKTLNIKAVI